MMQQQDRSAESTIRHLRTCTLANTPKWTLSGLRTSVKVLDVYDGDTVTLAVPCMAGTFRFRCRLARIDAAERSRGGGGCEDPSADPGAKARERLQELCTANGGVLRAEFTAEDKYGRPLVELRTDDDRTFSDVLLSEGLATVWRTNTKP